MQRTLFLLTAVLLAPLAALHAADAPTSTNPKANLPATANAETAMEVLPCGSVKAGGEIGRRIELTIAANLLKLDIESDFLEPLKKRNGAYIGVGILLDAASRLGTVTSDERVKAIRDRVAQALIAAQEDDGYIGYKPPADRVCKLFDSNKNAQIILGRSRRALPLLRATAGKITKEAGLKGGADARTKV
jgi:hypothetical protein